MRTTYYPFIDESTPEGSKTLADSAQDQIDFGVGISSSIGIGTLPRASAQLAIHFDGSEDNRTGGFEINANSNSSGDKHGARILAYNRVTANKGFRRLRFQASEYSIETPDAGISSTNSVTTLNITGFGSVGIGTTDPLAKLDVRGDARFSNKIYDKDGDSGNSGQVLSSTGTQVDWVNVGTLSAGTASQVAVTASNDNSNFNITFVDSPSGNQSIKADTNSNFIYNPYINRLELNTFNGTGLMLSGSGSEYVGMQLKTSDSSASQTRNIFIDTVNELGNAVANQVGQVQSDGGSHWKWETQPSGDRTDRRVERLRITSDGKVGIASAIPNAPLDVHKVNGTIAVFGDSRSDTFERIAIKNNVASYPAITNDSTHDTLDLRSMGSVQATIDSNNNDTGNYFRVMANGEGGAGTEVFRVQEDGNSTFTGTVTATKFVGDGSDLTNLPGGGSYGNNDVNNHLNVSGASSGQILSWNGSDYAWVADQTGGGGGASAFTALSDTPGSLGSAGQYLKVNSAGNALEFTAALTSNVQSNWNATSGAAVILNKPTIPSGINDLSDVSSSGASSGQVLKWNGSAWAPASDLTASGSGISLTDLSVTTGSASGGGSLSYNNSSGVFTFVPAVAGGGSGISNVVEDTSPQLGGDLDMNSKFISSGILGIKNTGSQSELRLYCEVSNAHYASLKAPAHADFSGNLTYTLPSGYGSNGQVLKTDGSGGTSWVNQTTDTNTTTFTGLTDTPGSLTARKYLRVNSAGNALEYGSINGIGEGAVNVKDYGATGNGSTDDRTSIINAISALGANGGTVFFPPGDYKIGSTITVNGNSGGDVVTNCIRFIGLSTPAQGGAGDAGGSELFVSGGSNYNIFNFVGVEAVHMINLRVRGGNFFAASGTGSNSSNHALRFEKTTHGGNDILLENMVFCGVTRCVHLVGTGRVTLRKLTIGHVPDASGDIIRLEADSNSDRMDQIRIEGCVIDGAMHPGQDASRNSANGISIYEHTNTIFITNTSVIRCNYNFYCDSGWNGEFLYFVNCEAERAKLDGFYINGGEFISIDNCFSCSNYQDGIHIANGTTTSVSITNPNVRINGGHGINHQAGSLQDLSIVNPRIGGNNASGSGYAGNGNANSYSGIYLANGTHNVYISGGRSGGDVNLSGSATQKAGVEIDGTSHDNVRVIGINVNGNVTGGTVIPSNWDSTDGNWLQMNPGSTDYKTSGGLT